MFKKDLFVFPDIVNISGEISLNCKDGVYCLMYQYGAETHTVHINPNLIADGNVAMVIYSPLNNSLFVHYGFSQLCESMNVTHSEFLKLACVNGLMQIDRYGKRLFIKVFLPKKQYSLYSDTDDYSDNAYLTADCCHPLDWQYIPTYELIDAKVEDEKLYLTLGVCRPSVDEAMGNMHINYAGQCAELQDGEHTYVFHFVKKENAYVGYPYSRRKGRIIDIERAVMLCIN